MQGEVPSDLRDEALRKIGRNLVNFQRFERALKWVIVRSDLRGSASQLASAHRAKEEDTERKPMGWLVEELFKTVYSSDARSRDPSADGNEAWMSFSFRLELDRDSIRARKRELSSLVKERNVLIHKALASFDPESPESCQQLISMLDAQNDKLEPHYRSLVRTIDQMRALQQEALRHLEGSLDGQVEDGGDAA